MKRYNLLDGGISGNFDMVMSENSRGEWVKWEDVKGAVDWTKREAWIVDNQVMAELECIECTCAKLLELDRFGRNILNEAVCPAHGYKKR